MPETITAPDEMLRVPLDAIAVREGFNPRSNFDRAAIDRLAETMRTRGVLQPLLVRSVEGEERFELVDGERRYRAALVAELVDVPVIVTSGDDVDGADLVAALTANFHRAGHTPVEEAKAFARLLDAGLTRKGICEQLQVSRELVRDRLEILQLPEELHDRVDDGTIPLGAVKSLVGLAKIHVELPACALRRVLAEPVDAWRRRVSWPDVVADPIGAVSAQYGDEEPHLPEGVFEAFARYPLSTFELDARAEKAVAALAKLNPAWADREQVAVSFDRAMVEAAAALGAAHQSEHGHSALIIGADIAAQLVGDSLQARLKDERAARRRAAPAPPPAGDVPRAPAQETPEQATARKRQERQAELERRAHAQAFNLELGIAVLKAFGTVRLDARALQVLSAVNFSGELGDLAARGARYGFPGWPTEETTPSGKTKTVYLERYRVAAKAHEFLAGAQTAGEIAGRCLALAVMAVLADEECVARSNRSMVDLYAYRPSSYVVPGSTRTDVPWTTQVVELIEDLALERLPDHLTATVRERREAERTQAEQRAEQEFAAVQADTELRELVPSMSADERSDALREFTKTHGRHTERAHNLRELILTLNATTETPADEHTPVETQVDNAVASETPADAAAPVESATAD